MSPSILLVDVASSARDDWKSFLQRQKFEVYTTEDGESTVRQCTALQPNVVLLFDRLPDIEGIELCRRLKAHPLNRLTPIVLVKTSCDSADIARGVEAGVDDFWGTPPTLWDGITRVQSLLRLRTYIDEQAKSVLLSLARSLEAKNILTQGHSERIGGYAVKLGESLELSEEELYDLRMASWLHDIGKVAVPDSILLKAGPLKAEEMEIVKQHPITGESICAPLRSLRHILPVIRHHHERMDGSGYPDRLRGDEIPLKARILQIADIYDALITERPYRKALTQEQGMATLRTEAGKGWLDESLVWRFCRLHTFGESMPVRGRSMLASYYA